MHLSTEAKTQCAHTAGLHWNKLQTSFIPFWNQGNQEMKNANMCMHASTKAKMQCAQTGGLHWNKLQASLIPFWNQGIQDMKIEQEKI